MNVDLIALENMPSLDIFSYEIKKKKKKKKKKEVVIGVTK